MGICKWNSLITYVLELTGTTKRDCYGEASVLLRIEYVMFHKGKVDEKQKRVDISGL